MCLSSRYGDVSVSSPTYLVEKSPGATFVDPSALYGLLLYTSGAIQYPSALRLEITDATGDTLEARLRTIHADLPAARARARRLHETALRSDREMIAAVAAAGPRGEI